MADNGTDRSEAGDSFNGEELDATDLFLKTVAGSYVRPTRRRLHLGHHYTEEDNESAQYAKKIVTRIALALEADAPDEAFKVEASRMATRVAHAIAFSNKDNRHELMLRINTALKDPKNSKLREDIVHENIPPEILIHLSEEQLANPEERRRVAKERRARDAERNEEDLKKIGQTRTHIYPCPECGEKDAFIQQRATDQVKFWVSDDDANALCTCVKCGHAFKA